MVTVRIGTSERSLSEADPSWINQQVNARRKVNEPVCVVVSISTTTISLRLVTSDCGYTYGGGLPLNSYEQRIVEIWRSRRMSEAHFVGGDLISFLEILRQRL